MARGERPIARPSPLRRLGARLRAFLRRNELVLITLGFLSGSLAGLFAAGILRVSFFAHEILFGAERLSSIVTLGSPWHALIPAGGGLLLGLAGLAIGRWRKERPVDPIEANALRGGRMSLTDSVIIVGQTLISNGAGASVGLEAAYTQIGSGFASFLGGSLGLRRADLRTLVGCGAAGAISAAFAAPLTGAFYAFELILGAYTPFGLAPVGAAAIGGAVVARLLGSAGDFVKLPESAVALDQIDIALLFALAIVCAAFGVAIMRGVGMVESLFRWIRLPQPVQPMLGGLVVGGLAMLSPHVLASGHSAAIALFDDAAPAMSALALAVVGKSVASAVSIGSGFRGGLFFASLYLGSLIGALFAQIAAMAFPLDPIDGWTAAIVGMISLAVAIVGGPLTMSFLALESTHNFTLSLIILTTTTLVSVIVRRSFGYSFATWRLHLRGESIRGAQDVGWMRDLSVGRLMRGDVETARADMPLAEFIRRFPLGSAQWVVAVNPTGRYLGIVFIPDAYLASQGDEAADVSSMARLPGQFLLPEMDSKTAAQIFERSESEALAVVDNRVDRRLIGLLTEAHLLRRYAQELDKARRELSGEPFLSR